MDDIDKLFIICDSAWGDDLDQQFVKIIIFKNGVVDYHYINSIAGWESETFSPTPFLERFVNQIIEMLP